MYLHYSFGKFYCTSDTIFVCVPNHQFFHASAIATGYSRHARDLAIEKEPGSAADLHAGTPTPATPCAIPTPAGTRHSLQGGRCARRLLTTDAVNFVVFFFFARCGGGRLLLAKAWRTLACCDLCQYISPTSCMGEHQVI
jgi:hypothetical protein